MYGVAGDKATDLDQIGRFLFNFGNPTDSKQSRRYVRASLDVWGIDGKQWVIHSSIIVSLTIAEHDCSPMIKSVHLGRTTRSIFDVRPLQNISIVED